MRMQTLQVSSAPVSIYSSCEKKNRFDIYKKIVCPTKMNRNTFPLMENRKKLFQIKLAVKNWHSSICKNQSFILSDKNLTIFTQIIRSEIDAGK